MANSDEQLTKELVDKIQQFLSRQIETNAQLSEAAKESLTVANECIGQAYGVQQNPASNELLDIYKSHKQNPTTSSTSASNASGRPQMADPASLIQNLATTFLSHVAGGPQTTGQQPPPTTATNANSESLQTNQPPKVRKTATEAEKLAAESFKNQGNDYMKQDEFKKAYDCYTQAIEIDDNNAIYYSNRAAASSKLGDHQSTVRDCEEAIEIDSNYSKAYGRMGLAYASLGNHQKSKEAYVKAVELDPTNESYRNNLQVAEEKLAESQQSGGPQANPRGNVMNMLQSMMSNPEVMSMAMRSLQDPRMQNLFGFGGTSAGSAPPPGCPGEATQQSETSESVQSSTANNINQQRSTNSSNTSSNQQQGVNPADLFNLTSRLAHNANIDLVSTGAQLLTSMSQNNPDAIDSMRRMMNQVFMPPNNQNSNQDRNPPPGYS